MHEKHLGEKILELCSEDFYGSWELWWAVRQHLSSRYDENLAKEFVLTLSNLVNSSKLKCYQKTRDERFDQVIFAADQLAMEIANSDTPIPASSYWFSTR